MRVRNLSAAAAIVVLVAACGGEPEPGAAPDTDTDTETSDPDDADPDASAPEDGDGGQPDLPDPAEFISDGVFRGQGVVMPVPEGWTVSDVALAQALVAAVSDEDPNQQMAAQAIDTSGIEGDVEFDELLEAQRTQFGEDVEPTLDEAVEIEGAERAHRLRFEDVELPAQEGQPEQPPFSLELILAEGEERIALFNYAAPPEEFDTAIADRLADVAAIDPDSEPPAPPAGPAPQPPPAGGGAGGDTGGDTSDDPIPVEPDGGIGDGAGPPDDAGGDTGGSGG